jgi:biotin carboxyl carrier protein
MAELKVEADLAGAVWKLTATPGETLAEGDPILILESMKMEIPVESPCAARLLSLHVTEGEVVREGQLLATLTRD